MTSRYHSYAWSKLDRGRIIGKEAKDMQEGESDHVGSHGVFILSKTRSHGRVLSRKVI